MQLTKKMKSISGAFAALVLAATSFVAATGAQAAEGNPDLTKTGSITVHKYANPAWANAKNDGTEQTAPATATALDGVQFSVQKLTDFDLSDATSWSNLEKLTYSNGKAMAGAKEYTLGTATTMQTANGGVAKFDNLAAGVYLVTEGEDLGNNNIISKAAPFFVSVPLPNETSWLYDVHAYPKNSVSNDGEKVPGDTTNTRKVGDDQPWTITYPVPALGEGETYTKLGIEDNLSQYLKYSSVSATLAGAALAQDVDYTVTVTNETKGDTDTTLRQLVTVHLTAAGLAKVKAGDELKLMLNTKITGFPTNGEIDQAFGPIVNDYQPGSDTTKTDKPVTMGDFWIQKQDKDNQKALEGAEFTVYESEDDAKAGTNPVTTLISDAQGKAVSVGLDLDYKDSKKFYIKETKAPAGYVLNNEVKEITVKKGQSTQLDITIDNTKQTGPNLPLTGSTGQILMTLAGIAVLASAVGLSFVYMRRNRRDNV